MRGSPGDQAPQQPRAHLHDLRRLEAGRRGGAGPLGPARLGARAGAGRARPQAGGRAGRHRASGGQPGGVDRPVAGGHPAACVGHPQLGVDGYPQGHPPEEPGRLQPGGSPNALLEAYGPLSDPQLVLVPAPLYHNNGFMHTANLLAGDRLLLLQRFNAARLLDAIERHRVTGFVATTIMLQRISASPAGATATCRASSGSARGCTLARMACPVVDRPRRAHALLRLLGSSEGAGAAFSAATSTSIIRDGREVRSAPSCASSATTASSCPPARSAESTCASRRA